MIATEDYELPARIARGRDLDVYDAWSTRRGCRVVLKVLRPDGLDPDKARHRLLREGELLARFTHPHLVRAYEVLIEPEPAGRTPRPFSTAVDAALEPDPAARPTVLELAAALHDAPDD